METPQEPIIFEKIYKLLSLATDISTHTRSIDEKLWVIKDEATWCPIQQDTWTVVKKLDTLIDSLLYSKSVLEKIDTMVL